MFQHRSDANGRDADLSAEWLDLARDPLGARRRRGTRLARALRRVRLRPVIAFWACRPTSLSAPAPCGWRRPPATGRSATAGRDTSSWRWWCCSRRGRCSACRSSCAWPGGSGAARSPPSCSWARHRRLGLGPRGPATGCGIDAGCGSLGAVRIATWNIKGAGTRKKYLLRWLAARKPDVAALQRSGRRTSSRRRSCRQRVIVPTHCMLTDRRLAPPKDNFPWERAPIVADLHD